MQAAGQRTLDDIRIGRDHRVRSAANRMLALLVLAAGMLQGCATNTTPVPQPSATPAIPVTLIESPEPLKLSIMMTEHPEASGGFESVMIFVGKMSAFGTALTQATQPLDFRPGAALTSALAADLSRAGKAPTRIAAGAKERRALLDDYQGIAAPAGVVIDVVPLAVGYWNKFPDGPFRPWVVVAFREYDPVQRKVVTTGRIGTGPSVDGNPMIAVPDDDRFAFASFDALTADPRKAVAGMQAVIQRVAQALSNKL